MIQRQAAWTDDRNHAVNLLQFHINDVAETTPDVQYIHQPSGMSSVADALAFGILFYLPLQRVPLENCLLPRLVWIRNL